MWPLCRGHGDWLSRPSAKPRAVTQPFTDMAHLSVQPGLGIAVVSILPVRWATLRPLFANSTLTIECRNTMTLKIEDYALIGNMRTTALVDNNGSIDWLCLPRFDSGACFAALLGSPDNGHWRIAPVNAIRTTRRRYRGPTLILENEFVTDNGAVVVVDFMPIAERHQQVEIVRLVRGLRGAVPMRMEVAFRLTMGTSRYG